MAKRGDKTVDLERENAELRQQLAESLAQQTATAEVLQVINASRGDLAPVFDAMLDKAMTLCGAAFGALMSYDGEKVSAVATRGLPPELADVFHERVAPRRDGDGPYARFLRGEPLQHIVDMAADDVLPSLASRPRALVEIGGARTGLEIPLRKEGALLGSIWFYRREVRPFSDKQIALVQNFAAQAVIAMENARLITETREALDQQTATAEVLGVINSSPGDLAPVFDVIANSAARLCNALNSSVYRFDGKLIHFLAESHFSPHAIETTRRLFPAPPSRDNATTRAVANCAVVHITDVLDDPDYRSGEWAKAIGLRSVLSVPMLSDGRPIGVITVNRAEAAPFPASQVELLKTFAAQAVIAIENARLITETREALEQQTATAEVLGVINSSPGDLAPVFDAMLGKALSLCQAVFGALWTYDGACLHLAVSRGDLRIPEELIGTGIPTDTKSHDASGRLLRGEPIVHIVDILTDQPYASANQLRRILIDAGGRTLLAVPLWKDQVFLGYFAIYRREVRPFSDKQIALLQNFAAQAVIAMENARLITETREALDQQTATAEVLGVINSSPGDLAPVFDTMLEKAMRLCGAAFGAMTTFDGTRWRGVAGRGLPQPYVEYLAKGSQPASGGTHARILAGAPLVHVADLMEEEAYRLGEPARRALVDLGRARTAITVPLRKDATILGAFTIYRQEVRPFTDKQIALLQNFAAQAVIAMENARLITETREARDDAEAALGNLKQAQANLIQAEKMASLGQLTAGIAHEIKNPLNFVNNFASLSNELLAELKEIAAPAIEALGGDKRTELDETMAMLSGNLDKIAEHGRRADGIVKSMLAHSRGGSGDRQVVDLNALLEESLNLAYHGARAQDQSFNITLERDFDKAMKPVELVPQDITRVLLNLFGNGFYAANKRAHAPDGNNGGGPAFRPVLHVATHDLGNAVEIKVRDNGTGIPAAIKDKLFQPFFTTKPTGEGTGLGLSISYDIVTQQHGGTIAVASEEGEFTEFTIHLPRGGQAATPGASA